MKLPRNVPKVPKPKSTLRTEPRPTYPSLPPTLQALASTKSQSKRKLIVNALDPSSDPLFEPPKPPTPPKVGSGKTTFKDQISRIVEPNILNFYDSGDSYPLVTATQLAQLPTPPTRIKITSSEYIQDSLYNPQYGYFSTHKNILDVKDEELGGKKWEGFRWNEFQNSRVFEKELGNVYNRIEEDDRGVWHTPVELFKVYSRRFSSLRVIHVFVQFSLTTVERSQTIF
jgi:hypothetical protein